jgi:hypothetical protein
VNSELEGNWAEVAVAYSRYYSGISLEELKKITEILSQGNRYPDMDSNRTPPEYKSTSLPLDQPSQAVTTM